MSYRAGQDWQNAGYQQYDNTPHQQYTQPAPNLPPNKTFNVLSTTSGHVVLKQASQAAGTPGTISTSAGGIATPTYPSATHQYSTPHGEQQYQQNRSEVRPERPDHQDFNLHHQNLSKKNATNLPNAMSKKNPSRQKDVYQLDNQAMPSQPASVRNQPTPKQVQLGSQQHHHQPHNSTPFNSVTHQQPATPLPFKPDQLKSAYGHVVLRPHNNGSVGNNSARPPVVQQTNIIPLAMQGKTQIQSAQQPLPPPSPKQQQPPHHLLSVAQQSKQQAGNPIPMTPPQPSTGNKTKTNTDPSVPQKSKTRRSRPQKTSNKQESSKELPASSTKIEQSEQPQTPHATKDMIPVPTENPPPPPPKVKKPLRMESNVPFTIPTSMLEDEPMSYHSVRLELQAAPVDSNTPDLQSTLDFVHSLDFQFRAATHTVPFNTAAFISNSYSCIQSMVQQSGLHSTYVTQRKIKNMKEQLLKASSFLGNQTSTSTTSFSLFAACKPSKANAVAGGSDDDSVYDGNMSLPGDSVSEEEECEEALVEELTSQPVEPYLATFTCEACVLVLLMSTPISPTTVRMVEYSHYAKSKPTPAMPRKAEANLKERFSSDDISTLSLACSKAKRQINHMCSRELEAHAMKSKKNRSKVERHFQALDPAGKPLSIYEQSVDPECTLSIMKKVGKLNEAERIELFYIIKPDLLKLVTDPLGKFLIHNLLSTRRPDLPRHQDRHHRAAFLLRRSPAGHLQEQERFAFLRVPIRKQALHALRLRLHPQRTYDDLSERTDKVRLMP